MNDTWERIEDVPEGVAVTDKDGDYWPPHYRPLTPKGRAHFNTWSPFRRAD
jgi:hypothetical protein